MVDLYVVVELLFNEDFGILVDDFFFCIVIIFDYFFICFLIIIGVVVGDSNGLEDIFFIEGLIIFEDGIVYIVIVNGIFGDVDFFFELVINGDVCMVSSVFNLVGVIVFYGFFGVLNVDIVICSNGVIVIVDLFYGDYFVYLEVENVVEFLEVCVVGDFNFVVIFNVDVLSLLGGVSIIVFVSGIFGDELVFGFFVVLFNGVVVELGSVSCL